MHGQQRCSVIYRKDGGSSITMLTKHAKQKQIVTVSLSLSLRLK